MLRIIASFVLALSECRPACESKGSSVAYSAAFQLPVESCRLPGPICRCETCILSLLVEHDRETARLSQEDNVMKLSCSILCATLALALSPTGIHASQQ